MQNSNPFSNQHITLFRPKRQSIPLFRLIQKPYPLGKAAKPLTVGAGHNCKIYAHEVNVYDNEGINIFFSNFLVTPYFPQETN